MQVRRPTVDNLAREDAMITAVRLYTA